MSHVSRNPKEAAMCKRACLSFLIAMFAACFARAAEETSNPITKDMSGWKYKNQKASLWKVVGDVTMGEANNEQLSPSGEAGTTPILVNDLKVGQLPPSLTSRARTTSASFILVFDPGTSIESPSVS
jgi:hypothetical protein